MQYYLFCLSFLLSAGLHLFFQKIFTYYKKFDDFNHRSSHNTLATRTGGIGIFTTLLVISLYFYFQKVDLFDYSLFIPIGIMFIVGVYDDFYKADFKLKFLLQIIVAKILIDQGYIINNYNGLFGLYEIPWVLAQLTTAFVFLIIVNAINFIDGIDGLAISEIIKIILFFEFFSGELNPLRPISVILIASLIPLFYFNFKNKPKVFLGDGGTLLLGTVVSIWVFHFLGNNFKFLDGYEINKTLLSILILLYPLTDLLRVFVIRTLNRKSPFQPDQNHIHHKLLKYLKKHYKVVFIIQLVSIIFGCVIILITK